MSRGSLSLRSSSGGWITLEIMLALVLLSVVMLVLERQSASQWQTLQQGEQVRQLRDNAAKQALMVQLTGSEAWLDSVYSSRQGRYPVCEPCTGVEFSTWFGATQHRVSTKVQALVPADE